MAALALLLGNMATVPRQVAETQPRPVAEIGELCEWMKKNTGHDDAFFATIQMSAPILLHTDRPSLVHPIWEWPSSREKYEGLLQAAYGDEEPFWRALRKYKAAYFIYDRSMALPEGGGSLRYIAGQTGPLDFTWTVTKCQFAPESLRSFDLAWQNGLFRVYRLRESPAQDTPERAKELAQFLDDSYDPVFDARNFDRSDRGYVNTLPALEVILRANALVNQAMIAMDFSDRSSAEKYLQEAIRICPRHLNAYLQLAFLAHVEGQPARELECLKRAQAIAPLNREVARRMQPLLNPTPETLTTVQPATSLTITTPNPGRK
jgi:tetratricopeptide (TPR) repeat protein